MEFRRGHGLSGGEPPVTGSDAAPDRDDDVPGVHFDGPMVAGGVAYELNELMDAAPPVRWTTRKLGLDTITGGVEAGAVWAISGPPGAGTTSLATTLVAEAALDGADVVVCNGHTRRVISPEDWPLSCRTGTPEPVPGSGSRRGTQDCPRPMQDDPPGRRQTSSSSTPGTRPGTQHGGPRRPPSSPVTSDGSATRHAPPGLRWSSPPGLHPGHAMTRSACCRTRWLTSPTCTSRWNLRSRAQPRQSDRAPGAWAEHRRACVPPDT